MLRVLASMRLKVRRCPPSGRFRWFPGLRTSCGPWALTVLVFHSGNPGEGDAGLDRNTPRVMDKVSRTLSPYQGTGAGCL